MSAEHTTPCCQSSPRRKVYFTTSSTSGDSILENRDPDYTVGIDDGLFDQDFNDVVLSVALGVIAGVDCSAVERGQVVTCRITTPVDTVLGWQFAGLPSIGQDTIYVSTSAPDTTWSGVAVARGSVSAFVKVNGVTDTLIGLLVVSDRPWRWGPSQWTFVQDGGQLCNFGPFYTPTDSVVLGENTRRASCLGGSIEPPIRQQPDSGVSADSVRDGPNDGLWYITAARYEMDRGSSMNPFIRAGGQTDTLQAPADKSACRRALGLGHNDPVVVNFYTYNTACQAYDLTPMFNGIWTHEGFGTKSQTAPDANGHEARRRQAAGQLDNDPYRDVERLILPTRASLLQQVANRVDAIDQAIEAYANDHSFVKDNWCGDAWVLDTGQVKYSRIPIRQQNGSCI